jgi:hypothetical protein
VGLGFRVFSYQPSSLNPPRVFSPKVLTHLELLFFSGSPCAIFGRLLAMSEAAQERRDAEHYAETGQRAVYHTTTSAHTGRPIVTKYFVSDDDDGGLADQFMEDVQHHDVGYGSPNDDDQGQEEHMQEEEQVDSSDSTTSNSDIDSDGSFANYDATADVKKAFQSALQRANYDATTDVKKASQRSLQKAHLHLLRSRGHSQRAPPARAVLRRHHPYGGAQGARGAGHKASRWNTKTGMWEFSEPPSTSSPSVARRGHNATQGLGFRV